MTTELENPEQIRSLVDGATGLIDRRIYADQEIFDLEMEKIYARAWLFMCHDSMIPNPGDFFQTYMGEDRVIVVRDKQGQAQVLLNTCRHRGNAVCRAEEGHATSFMCTYHGWTYDLQGKLVGVPGFKDYYHEDLNRDEWGLVAAKVQSYKGFIFATLDQEAPSLEEFLGDVGKMSIDLLAIRGTLRAAPGVEKYTIGCNWKFAADNVWDFYHAPITHASAGMSRQPQLLPSRAAMPGFRPQRSQQAEHLAVLGEYGHAIDGPAYNESSAGTRAIVDNEWREWPEAKQKLGPVGIRALGNVHIFPNMWIQQNFWMIALRLPKTPTSTEIWWFTFTADELNEDTRRNIILRSSRHNGPAGMTEIDDGENWDQSTRGAKGVVSRRYPLHYGMNLGRGEIIDDETGPPHIDTGFNEHAQLWHYRNWAEWMAAETWGDLKANHPYPEGVM